VKVNSDLAVSHNKPMELESSTGVAIVRATSGGAQLLFIRRRDSKLLELPKGPVAAGETEEQAAVRIVLQEAGVYGVQVQDAAAICFPLQCKDKKVFFLEEGKKVVRVIRETIRVLLATPTEQFAIESREHMALIWISLGDLPRLNGGEGGVTFKFNHVRAGEIAKLALNHYAVAVLGGRGKSGGEGGEGEEEGKGSGEKGEGKEEATLVAGNSSFIRFFAVLDFEATCWNEAESGPGARAKQDAEAEIIEFPTVLYRVDGDNLACVAQFQM